MDNTFYVQITHRHKLAKVHQVPRVMKDKYLITQSWVSIGCATCSELLVRVVIVSLAVLHRGRMPRLSRSGAYKRGPDMSIM